MIMTDETRPKCFKCEKVAVTLVNGKWLCSECLTNYLNKLKEMQEKIMLEG